MNQLNSDQEIIQLADPDYEPGELSIEEEQQEAGAIAIMGAEIVGERAALMALLPPNVDRKTQSVFLGFMESAKGGSWSQTSAQYRPRASQAGLACGACLFYHGQGSCRLVEGTVEVQGGCRFALPPAPIKAPTVLAMEPEERGDAATKTPPVHRVIRWQGLRIGINYDPGEKRFPLSAPMSCCYGHIRGSYGAAPDGLALDVYLADDFHPDINYPLFKVTQRTGLGEPDEPKYMVGFGDIDVARDTFIRHAGQERFGVIEAIDGSELDQYREDVFHADSCCCEACDRKKRTAKKKAEEGEDDDEPDRADSILAREWGWIGDSRADPDEFDALRDRALVQVGPQIETWVKKLLQWMVTQGSLERARNELWQNPFELLKSLGYSGFERPFYQSVMLSAMYGRSQIADEIKAPRLDATDEEIEALGVESSTLGDPYPAWLKQEFREAIRYFNGKINLPRASYRGLSARYHDWAFSVAQMTRADLLDATRWLLERAMTEGTSFDQFARDFERLIGRRGWSATGHRIYTIFDTNIRGAHGAGRFEQMTDPEVLYVAPYWIWRWRDSPNPREEHKKLHNVAIPADHPFWRSLRIPAGYGCRCSAMSVTEDYVRRNGITVMLDPPDPHTIADPGFREPFSTGTAPSFQDRKIIKERMKRYSPGVRRALNEELRLRGPL